MPTFQTTATTSGTPVCLIARTTSSQRALRAIDHDVAIAVARCGRYSHSPSTKVRCRAAGSAPLGTSRKTGSGSGDHRGAAVGRNRRP